MPAASTVPSDAAIVLIPLTTNSLARIIISIHPLIILSSINRHNAEYTRILSARGSIIFPKFVTRPRALAILPSRRSVSDARQNITSAAIYIFIIKHTMKNGTATILPSVSLLGRFI